MRLLCFVPSSFCLLSLAIVCFAQNAAQVKRIDGSKIAAAKLTAGIKQIVDDARIAGLSVAIVNDNRIVYQDFFGARNTATGDKLDENTVLYAASLTKPLFAYAFLKLVERKTFDLDAPVCSYLKKPIGEYEKWRELSGAKDFERITARMILSHSSGLPVLRQIYNNKLSIIAEPGTRFYYSNEAMNLLGFAVEERTGLPLETLIRELVFEPLRMRRTSMIWQAEFEGNHALGYDRSGALVGAEKRRSARAAGSMVTTANDYARFVIAVMKREGLPKELFEQALTPQFPVKSIRGFGPRRDDFSDGYAKIKLSWGLGWGLFQTAKNAAFFHGGHSEGWQNYAVAYPQQKTAVVLMSNSDNFELVANKILSLTIGDKQSPLEWMGYFDRKD